MRQTAQPEFGAGLSVPEILTITRDHVVPYLQMPDPYGIGELCEDIGEGHWDEQVPVIEQLCEISAVPAGPGYRRHELGIAYAQYLIEWFRCAAEGNVAYESHSEVYDPDNGLHCPETPLQNAHHLLWVAFRVYSVEIAMHAAEDFVPQCPKIGNIVGDPDCWDD